MIPRSFGMIDAYSFGIKTFAKNFFLVLGIMCGVGAISILTLFLIHHFVMPLQVTVFYGADYTSTSFNIGFNYMIRPASSVFTPIQAILFFVASLAIGLFWLLGRMFIARIGLNSSAEKTSKFEDLMKVVPLLGMYLLVTFLITLVVTFGFILLIIPGVIFLMKYGFGDLIILDTDLGPIEAMKRSNELTYGHKWRLFGFYLLFMLLVFLFSLIVPFFGFALAWVIFTFARAHVYRALVEINDQDKAQFTAMKPGL